MDQKYRISQQFKESLLVLITKTILYQLADNEKLVFSIDDALDELELGVADNGEILVLNPPKEIADEELAKLVMDRVEQEEE